jgi:hypothetical protein
MIHGNQEKWSSIQAGTGRARSPGRTPATRSTAPGSCGADGNPDGNPGGYRGLPFAVVAKETPVK